MAIDLLGRYYDREGRKGAIAAKDDLQGKSLVGRVADRDEAVGEREGAEVEDRVERPPAANPARFDLLHSPIYLSAIREKYR